MTMTIHITNHSMTEANFNIACFFWQMAHSHCKRVEDGVIFGPIEIEPEQYYKDMRRTATTEEYYRRKIKNICERMVSLRGDREPCEQRYMLNISYAYDAPEDEIE